MNKNLHRTIFNAARGIRMAVQETARSAGKTTATASGLGVALSALLGATSVQGQIIGAPNVPGNQRPMVLAAPNGVPVANIQTPSAAGVSRNVYNRFDVQSSGLILNNSRTNTQTQLGGWVQGNPFLATGPARVILNEVNSGSPSQIRGYIEVAGQRAEVIVANPAGIYVDGAGFINASKATLTTGVPQLNAFGGLDGYRVSGGTISIDGKGLDLSLTDYAAIYARALQVNAGIWANDLKVVTGANEIGVNDAAIAPIPGTGPAPAFALDVAALGGMYSNKIVLVGSEAGLGVRNAGSIGAGAGGLIVTAAGRLENTGTLEGARVELASTSDTINQGTIRQSGTAGLTLTAPTLSNTQGGVIGAEPLNTGSSGSTDGGVGGNTGGDSPGNGTPPASSGSNTSGGTTPSAPVTTAPPAPGTITAAGAILNDGGKIYAGGPIELQTPQVNNAGGSLNVASMAVTGPTFSNAGGTLNIASGFRATVDHFDNSAGGKLTAGSVDIATTGGLNNQDGTIASNGDTTLNVGGSVNNQRGAFTAAGTLSAVATGTIDNSGGRLAGNGQNQLLQSNGLVNMGGQIEHAGSGTLNITAGSYSGAGGKIVGNGAVVATIAGDFNQDDGSTYARHISLDVGSLSNRGGEIVQSGTDATHITAHGALLNNAGTIASNGAVDLTAGSLTNQGGSIHAAGTSDLSISTAGLLDNSADGEIGAGGNLALNAGSLANDSGRITAVGDLIATVVGATSNVAGTIAANSNTTVSAASLDSTRGTVGAVNGDLRITTVGATVNAGGTMQAGGNVALTNSGLDNTAGKVLGDALAIDTRGNALTNTQGTLAATTTVALKSGVLVNDAGLIQSGGAMTVNTNGQVLSNTNTAGYAGGEGGITSAGTLDLNTGSIDNTAGYIGSKGALTVNTGAFSNTGGGVVLSQSDLAIDTHGAAYDNSGGQTLAIGDLTLTAGYIANSGGLIRSVETTTVNAGTIANTNTQGTDQGIEGQNVALNVDNLENTSGAIRSDVNTTITSSGNLNNTSGLISAGDTLRVVDPNAANPAAKTLSLTNTNGTLVANELLALDAATFSGDGTVTSGKDLSIALVQGIVNTGEVSANGDLSYTTLGTLTNNGKLLAGGTLTAGGNVVENTANAEMSGTDTHIVAGTLNNRGLIDSHGQTRIDAGTVNNIGTGRIYGDHIAIAAGILNNDAEALAGETKAAIIASRGDVDLGVSTLNNREYASIFSVGDMRIGGNLTDEGKATGRASTLNNFSATIESLGNMALAADTVNNRNLHLVIGQKQSTSGGYVTITPTGGVEAPYGRFILDPDYRYIMYINDDGTGTPMGRGWVENHYTGFTTTTDYVVSSDPGKIVAGGDLSIDGFLINRDSHVLAGGVITTTQAPDNYSTPGKSVVHADGFTIHIDGYDTSGLSDHPGALNRADIVTTVDLSTGRYEQNLNEASDLPPEGAATVNVQSQGHAPGEVSGTSRPGVVTEVPSAVDGSGQAGGTTIPQVVRTSNPATSIPTSSLFNIHAGAGGYLIETDPRFASYRDWLSSDYLLKNLGLDPNYTLKRLGDGFYEQKLIREQVAQLTGYRYLDGFSSDEEQYAALMNAGVTFAEQYGLRPGIALTAAQMAQLTSDIVWLIEQDVTLPDGSTQRVLVPQVYVRVQPGDIDGSGGLLSGRSVVLNGPAGSGDLQNTGTIAGREVVAITADNINNLGGRITGGAVGLQARNDINNIGGTLEARDALGLQAGRDINVQSTTSTQTSANASRTNLDRVAGLYVTNPGGVLVAEAGRDINLAGALVANNGGSESVTSLSAGRDLKVSTVTVSETHNTEFDAKNYHRQSTTQEVGSQILGDGKVALSAGNDVLVRGSRLDAQGDLTLKAGRDISIEASRATLDIDAAAAGTNKSLFSSTQHEQKISLNEDVSVGSSLGGRNVLVTAAQDVKVSGSEVIADQNTTMVAGRNMTIEAAQDTRSESNYSSEKQTGLFSGGGIAITAGSRSQSTDMTGQYTSAARSTVGSINGDTTLIAGNQYTQTGSDVVAPNGDVIIAAKNIVVQEARETSRIETEEKQRSGGLTLALTSPIVNAIGNAVGTAKATKEVGSDRMKALGAATVALQATDVADAVMQSPSQAAGVNLSISIGGSKSQSNSTETTNTASGSNVVGKNVTMLATGGGQDSNITIQGSDITAKENAILLADNQINILAAKNESEYKSTNKSSAASVGVSFGTSGFLVNASASGSKGKSNGNDTIYSNSHVSAGNKATLVSGGDTTIRGGVISAETVAASIGGNLKIESLQDVGSSANEQKSAGGAVSVGAGVWSAGVAINNAKSSGNYASVGEQSGIKAGDGGFDVNVKGVTDLKGGVISSTQAAIDADRNTLKTAALITSDIQNQSSASAKSSGVALTSDMLGQGKYGAGKAVVGNALNNGSAASSSEGVTRAAVSGGNVVITDEARQLSETGKTAAETIAALNRDTATANVTVERQDVQALEDQAFARQVIANAAFQQGTTYSDEAYRKMFVEGAPIAVVVRNEDGSVKYKDDGNPEMRILSVEEKANLQPGPDGKIHVANNGIFNDLDAAAKYAAQHSTAGDGPQYFVYFPEASSIPAELMIAGYMRYLENPTVGLTNATQQNVDLLNTYGSEGLHLDGHSRGSMTVGNALETVQGQSNSAGSFGGTTVNFYGPAYNALKADGILATLQGRNDVTDPSQRDALVLQYQNHNADPVGMLSGGNSGTGGTVPPGSSGVWEALRAATGQTSTVHNCYGAPTSNACGAFWKDNGGSPAYVPVRPLGQ